MRLLAASLLLLVAACGQEATVPGSTSPGAPLLWVDLRDVRHLQTELAAAKVAGKPVVVKTWASWCGWCHRLDQRILATPALRRGFEGLVRLRIDMTHDTREDLRGELGMDRALPRMAFYDASGARIREADIAGAQPEPVIRAALERLR
jgi:thiol:disulfide interchange protein DsbD